MTKKNIERVITLKIRESVVDIIDEERSKFKISRTSWIIQAIIERMERLGHEVE